MYFISLIANNAVLATFVVFIIYVFTTLIFFMGSHRGDLYTLEEKMDGIHYRTSMVEQRVSRMDKKLDKWMKKKKNQSSSGDEWWCLWRSLPRLTLSGLVQSSVVRYPSMVSGSSMLHSEARMLIWEVYRMGKVLQKLHVDSKITNLVKVWFCGVVKLIGSLHA